jgi:hypothetical protein
VTNVEVFHSAQAYQKEKHANQRNKKKPHSILACMQEKGMRVLDLTE